MRATCGWRRSVSSTATCGTNGASAAKSGAALLRRRPARKTNKPSKKRMKRNRRSDSAIADLLHAEREVHAGGRLGGFEGGAEAVQPGVERLGMLVERADERGALRLRQSLQE